MIILDTDHVSLLQYGGSPAERILARLDARGHMGPALTTIITYEEQVRGWMTSLAAAKSVADQVRTYRKLSAQFEFFKTLSILEFSESAATQYQRLKGLKIRVGSMDLKIAAIALAHGATLYTRNARDFSQVPDLKFESATL